MKKIIVSDLDGTLLSKINKKIFISEENVNAIKQWKKENYFTVATGRNVLDAKTFLKNARLNPNAYMICSNGAVIYDYHNDKIIYQNLFPINYGLAITKYFKENDVGILHINLYDSFHSINYKSSEEKYKEVIKYINDNKVHKMGCQLKGYDREVIYNNLRKLDGSEKVNFAYSSEHYLDVQSVDSSKGKTLIKLKELLKEEYKVYSIGDYLNDYDMLKNADVSFAPANSAKEIKEIAKHLVNDHNNHAVANMIEIINKEEL